MLRARSAQETLQLLTSIIKKASISRVANLSDLDDTSSLYVYSAIRPLAKSLSVSMGKSLLKDDAKCGAIVESIETYLAEEIQPDVHNLSFNDLTNRNIEFAKPINQVCTFNNDYPLDWSRGYQLTTGEEIYFPFHVLSLNSNLLINQLTCSNSNGLASGNNFEEALVVGLFEQIERISIRYNKKKPLQVSKDLLISYNIKDDYDVRFYMYENDFQIPVVRSEIYLNNHYMNQCIYTGSSAATCYPSACKKSLEEAIQSKVGVVAGARDDLTEAYYKNENTIYHQSHEIKDIQFKCHKFMSNKFDDVFKELKQNIIGKGFKVGIFEYYRDELTVLKVVILDSENNIL
jgi:ribosomal protein S12 methylthiotransferase accessory factor